jgi:hypothetical protein
MNRIQVAGDRFRQGTDDIVLRGFNYWPSNSPGSDPVGGDWSVWCNYDAEIVTREVAAMAAAGANTVRVWFAYADPHWDDAQRLMDSARRNIRHFFETCRQNGIYVILTVGGGGSRWGVKRGLGDVFGQRPSALYSDPDMETQFAADVRHLLDDGAFASYPNLLAVDLANEPLFGTPHATVGVVSCAWAGEGGLDFNQSLRVPSVESAWKAWLQDEYGSVNEAADTWGRAPDASPVPFADDFIGKARCRGFTSDYQRFVHSCLCGHGVRLAQVVKDVCKHALVTIGFGYGGTGAGFAGGTSAEAMQILTLTQNVREMRDGLDFVSIHLYDGTTHERMRFLRHFLGSERPIVIEEFGAIPERVDAQSGRESTEDRDRQEELWKTILSGTTSFNFAGALGCNFIDTGNPDPARNIWSRMGIVTQTGEPKPAFDIFCRWARGDATPADFHPDPVPYDPADYANDVEAMGKLYQAFAGQPPA